MFRFPFYGYPYNNPYHRYYNNYPNNIQYNQNTKTEEVEKKDSITNSHEISNTIKSRSSEKAEEALFEILGIKLYLDDIIILGVLFFLYEQKVKDEMLYIILFLLLFA